MSGKQQLWFSKGADSVNPRCLYIHGMYEMYPQGFILMDGRRCGDQHPNSIKINSEGLIVLLATRSKNSADSTIELRKPSQKGHKVSSSPATSEGDLRIDYLQEASMRPPTFHDHACSSSMNI